jgi:hypothetical protein
MKVDNLKGILRKLSCGLGAVALFLFMCNFIAYFSNHVDLAKLTNKVQDYKI